MAVQQLKRNIIRKKGAMTAGAEMITQVAYFLCGAVISKGAVFGDLAPFGASLGAAVPFKYLFSSLAGSAFGYILLSPLDSFRYIAIVVAIGAIRWMLNDVKKISRSVLFAPVVAFLPVAATAIALLFSSTSQFSHFTMCLVEALAAGGAAFFLSQAVRLFSANRSLTSFNQQELASIVISGCILILAFNTLTLGKVSLGRIIAVLVILLCSRYGGVGIGSISGVATGVVFSLSSTAMAFLCGGYAFGGMVSGLFAPVGKIAVAIAFTICNTIMSFVSSDQELISSIFIETLIGCTIFMVLPKSFGNVLSSVFLTSEEAATGDALKQSVVSRLDYASKALEDVSGCVNSVSEKLSKSYAPTVEGVYKKAAEKTCSKCGLRVYCWEKEKETTADDFGRLSETLKKSGAVNADSIENLFIKKCCKQRELAESINISYKEYLAGCQAQKRVSQVRSVVAGQFAGLSEILKDLSVEFDNYERFDGESTERVTAALKYMGFLVIHCSCRTDSSNHMVVEVETSNSYKGNIKKSMLLKEVSKACGRRFDSPCITYASDRIRIMMNELPAYDVQIGTSQHVSNGGTLCGDCLNYFNNGFGSTVALISDGMGTGGRAAVDGNMATSIMTKLCKSGLSYDCALQVVNSSLMVKSEDESLATMDVTEIDLFTGRVRFMKAGAPFTFIKKNGKILKKELPSLPLGILNEVKFSKDEITLSAEDVIVMVSDGAMLNDDKWLENLIKSWKEGSANDLAAAVVNESIKRRNDGHDDDITAIVIKMIQNE